jgi:AcrR family transcriptional regulator
MSGGRFTRLPRDERRAQILEAARGLFGEGYYSAVSTAEVAAAAGVSPGLVHHYFGTKRELYLEVVRAMLRVPPMPAPEEVDGRPLEEVIGESVDLWLDLVRSNRETWVASLGAEGFGHDPELTKIFDDAREAAVARAIRMLGLDAGEEVPPRELRAVIRAYGGMAEEATREWLLRRRLSRHQVRILLTDSLLGLVREVLPRLVPPQAVGAPAMNSASARPRSVTGSSS